MVKGTIAAEVPMDFPTIALVAGTTTTIKMTNGKLLKIFITISNILYTYLFSIGPSLSVNIKAIAKTIPMATAKIVDTITIVKVSISALLRICISASIVITIAPPIGIYFFLNN